MPHVRPIRCALLGLALVALGLAGAPLGRTVHAEEPPAPSAYVVLDRGQGAQALDVVLREQALELVPLLQAKGYTVTVLLVGATSGGRPRLYTADPAPDQLQRALAREEGMRFEGPSDVRGVLRTIQQRHTASGPVDVLLLGPFGDVLPEFEEGRARDALEVWNSKGPAMARIFALHASTQGLEHLAHARGLVAQGRVVLDVGAPQVAAAPWSAFETPEPRLRATVKVPLRVLPSAHADPNAALQLLGEPQDQIQAAASPEGLAWQLERPAAQGRELNLTLSLQGEHTLWLAPLPAPVVFAFPAPTQEARLSNPDGEPATPFLALDVETPSPVQQPYRLLRTRSATESSWHLEAGHLEAASATLPAGLRMEFGPETPLGEDLVVRDLTLHFAASPATPLDVKGTLQLVGEEGLDALALPYHVRTAPGRWRLEADAASLTLRLPMSQGDEGVRLQLIEENENVPARLVLEAQWQPTQAAQQFQLVLQDERGARYVRDAAGRIDVGTARVVFARVLTLDASPLRPSPARIELRPMPQPGVQAEGTVALQLIPRAPRLVLEPPQAQWRREDGAWVTTHPLRIRLDADGGEGAWLLALCEEPPAVRALDGETRVRVESRGVGLWEVVAQGEVPGPRADAFEDQETQLALQLTWPHGPAPQDVRVALIVPARWGQRAWILVGLAGLALLLALMSFVHLRAPALRGTLLYTAKGLEGAVGRVELAGAGRRARLVSDARGRLALNGPGETLAALQSTRVGGTLLYARTDEGEEPSQERRLLVDGLQVAIGAHTLRYVSGLPTEAESRALLEPVDDLFGPEFDIESGRVRNLPTE